MENRFLNVSIMQHTITADLDTNPVSYTHLDVYKRQYLYTGTSGGGHDDPVYCRCILYE